MNDMNTMKNTVGVLLYRAGFNDIAPEDMDAAVQAFRLYADRTGPPADFYGSIAPAMQLLFKNPDNVAISYCLLEYSLFHYLHGDDSFYPHVLRSLREFNAGLEKRLASEESDKTALLFLRARAILSRWTVLYSKEYALNEVCFPDVYGGEDDLYYADKVLSEFMTACLHAETALAGDSELRSEFIFWMMSVISQISIRSSSVGHQLMKEAARVVITLSPQLSQDIRTLQSIGEALQTAARDIQDAESIHHYRLKALEIFDKVLHSPDFPLDEVDNAPEPEDSHLSFFEDYALLYTETAAEETDDILKQKLVEDSLSVIQARLRMYPEAGDWIEGYGGISGHYYAMSSISPFPERKREYLHLAKDRILWNTQRFPDPDGRWEHILANIDKALQDLD